MHYLRSIPIFILLLIPQLGLSQFPDQQPGAVDPLREEAVKVYLDCRQCDETYIRDEVTFVNFVRDRQDAQVHILVTSQSTASRGQEYTLAFIGQLNFAGKNDTLSYVSRQDDTSDIIREGLVRTMKLGLASYAAQTPLAEYLDLSFGRIVSPTAVVDKWDSWVFRVSTNIMENAEETRKSLGLMGSVSANRITEALKIRLSLDADYDESNIEFQTDWGAVTRTDITRRYEFDGLVVKSLTDHWSLGGTLAGNSSTYRNIDWEAIVSPAVEYNLFPYSESTRRELRLLYKVNASHHDYVDTTVYGETAESLFGQSLDINLELTERWGTVRVGLEASHYFHDLEKNRLEFSTNLSLRLFRGLSLTVSGSFDRIHDQLSLPAGGATQEEIYLRLRELETEWERNVMIGLSYTFGSIYSNVVNPRFGGEQRGYGEGGGFGGGGYGGGGGYPGGGYN